MDHTRTMEDLMSALTKDFSASDIAKAAIKADISSTIASARIAAGLSQEDLAGKIGKTQSAVSKWENGDMNFNIDLLVDIAAALDLDLTVKLKEQKVSLSKTKHSQSNFYGHGKVVIFPPRRTWIFANYTDELKEE